MSSRSMETTKENNAKTEVLCAAGVPTFRAVEEREEKEGCLIELPWKKTRLKSRRSKGLVSLGGASLLPPAFLRRLDQNFL